jgi:hypothetical protein
MIIAGLCGRMEQSQKIVIFAEAAGTINHGILR